MLSKKWKTKDKSKLKDKDKECNPSVPLNSQGAHAIAHGQLIRVRKHGINDKRNDQGVPNDTTTTDLSQPNRPTGAEVEHSSLTLLWPTQHRLCSDLVQWTPEVRLPPPVHYPSNQSALRETQVLTKSVGTTSSSTHYHSAFVSYIFI